LETDEIPLDVSSMPLTTSIVCSVLLMVA
jgi:hypothetical protein